MLLTKRTIRRLILWVDNVFENLPSIIKLRLARVVFCVTSSPFLLNRTVWNHVPSCHFDPEFVMQIPWPFFLDDFSGESKTTIVAFELYKKLKIRFLEGQFNFKEFWIQLRGVINFNFVFIVQLNLRKWSINIKRLSVYHINYLKNFIILLKMDYD